MRRNCLTVARTTDDSARHWHGLGTNPSLAVIARRQPVAAGRSYAPLGCPGSAAYNGSEKRPMITRGAYEPGTAAPNL